MRELASDERPRERLLKHGAEVLSDAELIAIILRSGVPGENVMDMSRALVDGLGGLAGLARADGNALQRTRGLGPAKAAQIAAAVELGRRVQQLDPDSRPLLTSPQAVQALLGPRLMGQPKEWLYALALDTRGRLLGSVAPVLGGSVNAVTARPAEISSRSDGAERGFGRHRADHPSGDPRPSPQDIAVTKVLDRGRAVLDLNVLDDAILGQNTFVSLQAEGMFK